MTVRPDEAGLDIPEGLCRQPLRVIVDGAHRVSNEATIFDKPGDILIAARTPPASPINRDTSLGALNYWAGERDEHTDIDALLRHLATQGSNEVLIESGAKLAGAFVSAGLVDELIVYCAPTLLGSDARPLLSLPLSEMKQQIRWQWQDVRMVGNDLRLTLRPDTSTAAKKA